MYQSNREAFMQQIKGGVAIIPSSPPAIFNHDTEHRYRQDSNFYYLTGFEEPEAICVIAPEHPEYKYVLFVRPRDPEKEIWTGRRAGVEGVKANYDVDEAYPIEAFDEKISGYLENADVLYYRLGDNEAVNRKIINLFKRYSQLRLRTGKGPNTLTDPTELLGEMRLIKSKEELARIAQATELTAQAHLAAMKAIRPGMYEYELEALIDSIFRKHGGRGTAFPTIVANGENATILHYTANNCAIRDGDLVLIDAGCEYKYYNGDITRTFPANGKFTETQREIYQVVLDVQLAVIETVRPGVSIDEPNKKAVELLTEGMVELGLLKGEKEKLIEAEEYKKFYMHRVGHMLGLDTHDVNKTRDGEEHKTFQLGMVTTVEPGLYIQPDSENVPSKYLGIGIRIEDDVLVTETGNEVLTAQVPKTVEDIEQFM